MVLVALLGGLLPTALAGDAAPPKLVVHARMIEDFRRDQIVAYFAALPGERCALDRDFSRWYRQGNESGLWYYAAACRAAGEEGTVQVTDYVVFRDFDIVEKPPKPWLSSQGKGTAPMDLSLRYDASSADGTGVCMDLSSKKGEAWVLEQTVCSGGRKVMTAADSAAISAAKMELIRNSGALKMLTTRDADSSETLYDLFADADSDSLDRALAGTAGVGVATAGDNGDVRAGGSSGGTATPGGGIVQSVPRSRLVDGGGAGPAALGEGLRASLSRFQYCVPSGETAAGRVALTGWLADGKVAELVVTSDSTGSRGLARCLIRGVSAMTFATTAVEEVSWEWTLVSPTP